MLSHKGGVPWYEAPAPPKKHKHFRQTHGYANGEYVERCPCGAIGNGVIWTLLDPPRVAELPDLKTIAITAFNNAQRILRGLGK